MRGFLLGGGLGGAVPGGDISEGMKFGDVVDSFVRAIDRGSGLTINIGTGVETSVQRLYDTMARLAEFPEPPKYGDARTGELERSSLDPGRAAAHLGWEPRTDLETGLARTLAWFRDRG